MIVRKQVAVGRQRLLGQPELEHGGVEVARALVEQEGRRRPVAVAVHAVAAEASPLIDLLAMGDPFLRARERGIHDLKLLRLEQVAPLAAVHAELLDIGDEGFQVLRLGGDLDRVAFEFLVRRQDDSGLVARLHRHEQQPVRIRREPDLLLAGEVEQRFGDRRLFQGAIAGSVIDDRDRLLRRRRTGRDKAP